MCLPVEFSLNPNSIELLLLSAEMANAKVSKIVAMNRWLRGLTR